MTLQGTPAAKDLGGMSRVTTLPAPITQPSPIVTPPQTVTFPASQQLSPIVIGFAAYRSAIPSPRGKGFRSSGCIGCTRV